MEKSSKHRGGHIRRRIVLQSAAALAIGGPAMLGGAKAGAQPRMNAPPGKMLFAYVGAFTTPERKGRGDGINVYRMDPSSGAWAHVQLVPNIINPSFLALDREQRFLYSVHADLDEVSAYAIDKQTGQLTPLNRQSCGGKNPVHLAIDPTNRFIVTANYGAGSVGVVPIEKDGTLGTRTDLAMLPGEPGPNRKEQASSHPHNCPFDPAGHFILVPDKGLDRVFSFKLDSASGKLTPADPPFVATREGAGPRHIAFHPSLPFAYVIDELDSTMTTYRYDPARGALQAVQVVPTIAPSFTGNNTGAEVAVAPSGRLMYGSNRGHDSIVIFAVDHAAGTLTPVGWEPTQGKTPRFFGLDPAANFLYAANQDTDTIVTFRVNKTSGKLAPTGQVVKVGSPVTIVFAGA
ncbi:MAG TPA: lactonase family protein [Stellaceae bacterium]|nr:lactonase family protein [Stellaceae bacterium]